MFKKLFNRLKRNKKPVNKETDIDIQIRSLQFAISAGEAAIRNQKAENEKNRKLLRDLQKKKVKQSYQSKKTDNKSGIDLYKSAYDKVKKEVKKNLGDFFEPNKIDLITKTFIEKKRKDKKGSMTQKTHDEIVKDLRKIKKGTFISDDFTEEQKEAMRKAIKAGKNTLSAVGAVLDEERSFYWDNYDNIINYNKARKKGDYDQMNEYGDRLSRAWQNYKNDAEADEDYEKMKKEGFIS